MMRKTKSLIKRMIESIILVAMIHLVAVWAWAQNQTAIQTTTSSLPAISGEGQSKWSASFFNLASVTPQQLDRGGSNLDSYGYVSFGYKLSSDQKISIRPSFFYNTAGFAKTGEYVDQALKMADIHFVYSDYDMGSIGSAKVSGSYKVYLPTSDASIMAKMITRLRAEFYVEQSLGWSTLTYVTKPDYYIQSQRASLDTTTPRNIDGSWQFDPRRTNKQMALEHYLEHAYDLSSKSTLKTDLGFIDEWYYSSETENLAGNHNSSLKAAIGIEVRPFRGSSFLFAVENRPWVANRYDAFAFGRPSESTYNLFTNIAF